MGAKMCQHCGIRLVCRPRGLCWTDYYTPGIRDLYGSGQRYGLWRTKHASPLAPDATAAPPGSEAKIRVMEERVRLGYSCFHPDDAGVTMLDEEAA